jgi:hypothetical protein
MLLRIAPTYRVCEVQNEFNKAFPFLKIEFFENKSGLQTDVVSQETIPQSRRIGDYQAAITDGLLEINEEMKVNELEKILKDQFRLNARIFRRSGNMWLQATVTDNWTLQKQNEYGMELSRSSENPQLDQRGGNARQ